VRNKNFLCFAFCLSFFFTSGCWDRTELSDQAIGLASGWDALEKGGVQYSGQIIIPSKASSQQGGGGEKSYFTVTATGQDVLDAVQNMQSKLSRKAFFGQRRIIFFGEEIAKRGLKHELDVVSRGNEVSLRADAFVVKGGTAKEILNLDYPLEKTIGEAVGKGHKQIGGRADTTFLSFLIAANSKGFSPTLPVIELDHSQDGGNQEETNSFRIAGVAVFNQDLKLLGYLNSEENRDLLWVMGILKNQTLTLPVKDSEMSLVLEEMGSKIEPEIDSDGKVKFSITLTGEGDILENNTDINLMKSKNLEGIQKDFEKQAKKQVLQTITKVQEEYSTDIFGFGAILHRKYPDKWRSLKENWDKTFAGAEFSVEANLTIRRVGLTGPSLLYKEGEIKK
jgi:spore germination protein KC